MTSCLAPALVALAAGTLLAPPGSAQLGAPAGAPAPGVAPFPLGNVRYVIPGKVQDLTRDSFGRILYCTAEGEVGRIVPGGPRTVLATAASGPFPNELRALAERPAAAGNIAVLDVHGNVRVMVGSAPPATLVYADLYMIADASDLICDARGSYLIASATPSSGQRAINWVKGDGSRWSYHLVKHQPLQLAHDPFTNGLVLSETTSGGCLRVVRPNAYRTVTNVDTGTNPGIGVASGDGDVAAEADGDLYWIAGGEVYKRTRATGTTTLFLSGLGQLRGVVIAQSTGLEGSGNGWSLYLAEGSYPSRVREFPGVEAPGSVIASDQGEVPWRGLQVNVNFGFQAFELTADAAGRLLVGGTNFGSPNYVKRVTLGGTPSISTVASAGLAGPIEGLCVAPDQSIYALARTGTIQRITENPLTLTTVFSDPASQITAGKDMALDVDGTLYVATREAWGFGKLLGVAGGSATLLEATEEARGLAAYPTGGLLVSQWHDTGFHGTVDLFRFSTSAFETLPGFLGMNYTNDSVWGDGDICVDANGSIYTVSEDDWSLVRYDPAADAFVRFGSGYLNHPSGLAIAPSTDASGSTTGWSLYVSEFDKLWEKPSVPPPASTLVDASLGLTVARSIAGAPHPRYGKPHALAPGPRAGIGLIGTEEGWVLALDLASGELEPVAGPEDGLQGAIVALVPAPDGRILVLDEEGELSQISAGRVGPLALDPQQALAVLERLAAAPQRTLRMRDPLTRREQWFVLEGWVVWRAGELEGEIAAR